MPFDGSGGRREDRGMASKPPATDKVRPKPTKRQSTALDFGELASRWQIVVNRTAADADARALVHIMWALLNAYRSEDPWLDGIARKSRDYLRKHNKGPRQRPAEANLLATHIQIDIDQADSILDIAKHLIHLLQALPELCSETCVPTAAYAGPDRRRDEQTVAGVFDRLRAANKNDAELWVKAALKALGHPSTKNMYAHRKM